MLHPSIMCILDVKSVKVATDSHLKHLFEIGEPRRGSLTGCDVVCSSLSRGRYDSFSPTTNACMDICRMKRLLLSINYE